jgi:outer membrane protein assembly factor BamA
MHSIHIFLALLSLVLLRGAGASPLRAQSQAAPNDSGKLASISVTGSKKYSSDQVVAASGLHVGDPVRRNDFQAAANRISELGLFSSVRYRFSSRGENVTLEYLVEDAPSVPVSFDNFPWFTDDELTQAVKQSAVLFDGTAPESGSILDEMADSLNKLLETRGVHAAVKHSVIFSPDGSAKLQQFKVVGSSLNVNAVEFSDPLAAQEPHVQERLSDIVGKPFSRFAMDLFDFEQVRPIYLQKGYLRIRFGMPMARFTGDPSKPLASTVVMIVSIEPGPVYKFGGIAWSGNSAVPASELGAAVGIKSGETADGMKIEAGWDRARETYGHHGYLDTKINPETIYDDPAAAVRFKASIVEGPQYRMGDLVLTGLSIEGERRLRDAWKIAKGEVFDRAYVDDFVAKGAKASFGELPFHYEKLGHWLRSDPKTGIVDVLLDFQ